MYTCIHIHTNIHNRRPKFPALSFIFSSPEHSGQPFKLLKRNTLQYTAKHHCWLQHRAAFWTPKKWVNCNTLQHTATHCNTLQHTATHCNTHCNAFSLKCILFLTCIVCYVTTLESSDDYWIVIFPLGLFAQLNRREFFKIPVNFNIRWIVIVWL